MKGENSTPKKQIRFLLGTLLTGIIIVCIVYLLPKAIEKFIHQPIATTQTDQAKCIRTTAINQESAENTAQEFDPTQNNQQNASLSIPYVTEDTGGCLKFVGDKIHFTLNAGEAGGVATVDIGDVHKGIQLFDDGTHGDKYLGDGIYELDYVTSQEDTVRSVLILGKYTSIKDTNALDIYSHTSITIVNWQSGESSVDSKAEFIEDQVTGDVYAKDRLVIGFKEGISQESVINSLANNNLEVASWIPELLLYEIELGYDQDYETIKSQLIALPSVLGVDRNYAVKLLGLPVQINDNRMPIDQSNYLNVIRAKLGWEITEGEHGIYVATIDSGIAVNHPDLQGKIFQYLCNPPACKYDNSDISHGTKIAGIIAAEKGQLGISGIAPGVNLIAAECAWDEKNQTCGDAFDISDRIWQTTNLGARVISLSFTTRGNFYLHTAIKYAYYYKNVVIVAGVGEDPDQGIQFYKEQQSGGHKVYPASYNEVIAVGASETDDSVAIYSDYGDLVLFAPVPSKKTNGILSTVKTGDYDWSPGTSYAAPQAAALAALIISENPNLTNDQVASYMMNTADPMALEKPALGRINIYRALMVASGKQDPGEDALPAEVTNLDTSVDVNNPPSVNITWTPPNIDDYSGVHIYREDLSDFSMVQLEGGLIHGGGDTYTDIYVSTGHSYRYYVFSVDSRGQESVNYADSGVMGTVIPPAPTPSPQTCIEESNTGIIAFIRDGNIWIIRDDGTCEMQLTTEGDYSFPAISPDASKIAFIKHLIVNTDKDAYQIGQLDLQTLQEEVLVDVEPTLLVMAGTYYDYASPKWSPDGNFLYYHVGDGRVSGDELRKLNLETRQITLIGGPGFQVIAEGSLPIDVDRIQGHIAAVRNMQILGESLTIFDENGIFERDIIPPTQIFIGAICWTYDGESIVYAKDESRHRLNYSLEWIDQNGTELGTIIPEIHLNDSINYPINLACSPYDQRLIYQQDGSLYIVDYPLTSERFLVKGTQPSWGKPASIPDTSSPPSTLTLDQQDVYSVIRYLVYLIMNKRSDLISPLIGDLGTSLHGAYGQEYQLPGFNNEGDVLAILDNSFQDTSPSCLGIDVGTYERQLLGYAHIFFQGLRCGFSERCSPNDDGSNIYNFLLRRNENNKWMLDYIGYDPESIKDLIEPLEQCPDVPMDPTINPIVIQNGASDICEYDSDFVADVTIPDNTQIAARTKFTKTWRLLNSGTCDWTPDYSLLFISGDQMDGPSQMRLDRIVPAGEGVDLSIDLFAPRRSGTYRGQWQLSLPSGEPFGTKPYVQIIVP